MKYCILFNPYSGHGGSQSRAEELKNSFGADSEVIDMTKIENCAEFLSGYGEDDVIVICGGDGTLNRFINNTDGIDIKCELLYAATGTGNDFLADLGKKAEDAPFSIKKYIKDLPVVTVNGQSYRFINGVGYGIDGYCCEEGDRCKVEKPGEPVNYTAIAIKGLLGKFKPANARIIVDGVEKSYKKVWLAPTMHGRYYGGGMICAPAQDRLAEDKMNTLVVWHGSCKLPTLIAFPSIFKGEHVNKKKMIDVMKGHEIYVEFDRPCALQIDGETILGVTSYSVKSAAKL